jgi:outer membrane protein assembly factor BamB
LDPNTGNVLWTSGPVPAYFSWPALANGVLYYGGASTFVALDAATGNTLGSWTGYSCDGPAVINGAVVVGCGKAIIQYRLP